MESRMKLLGHPVHPMLIVFPLGLLATSVLFDTLYSMMRKPVLAIASFYMTVSGVIGGLAAAIFGLIDWMALPRRSRASRVGAIHGVGNVIIVALFTVSAWLRRGEDNFEPSFLARLLSFIGSAMALVTAWLGGELVYRLGVAVDPGANLDAPNSLTHPPRV